MDERIKEAEKNVKEYIQDELLKEESFSKIIYDTYLRNSRESLALAENTFTNNLSSLWTVVISYYSMFYIANAVLYKIGYKVGEKVAHKVTADALIVYVRHKLKKHLLENYEEEAETALSMSDNYLENFDRERIKRSRFQYTSTEFIKQGKAKTSFDRAKEFCFEMEKLLQSL